MMARKRTRHMYDFDVGLKGYRHSKFQASVFAHNPAEARRKARHMAQKSVVRNFRKRF